MAPGATASLVINVVNTDRVIDGVSARVIGLPEENVRCTPDLLPLFPDAAGQLTLTIAAPRHMTAGRHPIVVEVVSHGAQAPAMYLEMHLLVEPRPELQLASRPKIAKGRRSGKFVIEVTNPGNVRLQVDLQASDTNRALSYRLAPSRLSIEPGRSAPAVLHVRAPRHTTGSPLDLNVMVQAVGQRLDLPPDWIPQDAPPLTDTVEVQLRQKAIIGRGLMTAFILASIVGLWAAAFLFGLAKVFQSQPATKQAPASFFWLKGVTRVGTANAAFNIGETIPGTLPKSGELPAGEASQITGTVFGWVDNQPVGRILVQAYRLKDQAPIPVSAAGTQADGTFNIAGLFPSSYYLKYSAKGFKTVWYDGTAKGTASFAGAKAIDAEPQNPVTANDLVIEGLPATIRGGVDPGATLTPVDTTVTAQLMIGNTPQIKQYTTHTNQATNTYILSGLPAPASYELTFTAKGYTSSAIVEAVSGGDVRFEPPIALSAGQGAIGGVVQDPNGTPIGGATVSTVVNGAPVTVSTPTIGVVGRYTLQNLPTPGTYIVTVSQPSYGTVTKIVGLGVGAQATRTNFDITLVAGTGSVAGKVVDDTGHGLGAVTVAVGGTSSTGAGPTPSTTTLTDGGRGNFAINGLVAPGSYTLTASLPGYQPTTVAFDLNGSNKLKSITISLSTNSGSISGTVTGSPACPEASCVNAKVTATNGQKNWTVAVSSPGGSLPNGGYLISDLPPGVYTVTVTDAGMNQQTALVTVVNQKRSVQNLTMTKAN